MLGFKGHARPAQLKLAASADRNNNKRNLDLAYSNL